MGGLNVALTNALSGINVSQQSLAATSGNITNANTAGYSRKTIQTSTVVSQGQSLGADPVLKRIVDEFMVQAQRKQTTNTSNAQIIKQYMDQIQNYLGSTDTSTNTTVSAALDSFFTAMNNLATTPDQSAFRTLAVQSAVSLSNTISGLAKNLQQTRYDADQDIATTIHSVNNDLDKLQTLNVALRDAYVQHQSQEDLLDQRDKTLKDIMQYLDLGVAVNQDATLTLFNHAGDILSANSGTHYHLAYTPAVSVKTFKDDNSLNSIDIIQVDDKGNPTGGPSVSLTTSGKSSSITTSIQGGKILGLLNIRDQEVPNMLEQLDSLSDGLRDAVNKISNNGVGYPPPDSLTGTLLIPANREVGFQGTVRIAALDANGKPAPSPYGNDAGGVTPPLTLDFSKIYGPNGVGRPTVGDIMNQINQYYGPPANRAAMGSLADTKLVAISDNTTGPFQFGLQFNNPSAQDLNITIVSVNGVASGANVTATAGQLTSTAPGLTFSSAGAGPYNVPVVIQYTDPKDGAVYHDTINYTVAAAASGLRGDWYSAASLGGTAVAPQRNGTLVIPTTNQRLATAQLVDANGASIASSSQPGYLQIVGNNGTTIGIDELDSNDIGVAANGTPGTLKGFSEYFQLNDFFSQNSGTALGSAAENLSVRKSLVNDPRLLAVGQLARSAQPTDPSLPPLYTYEVGISSNGAANAIASLQTKAFSFAAAGTLPATSNNITSYASDIYAYAGQRASVAGNNLDQQNILQQSFDSQANSVSGVNLDEELANTILYQNAYTASARIITIVNTLFGVLLQAGGQ